MLKVDKSEILVLLAESKESVCIIICGLSPYALWQRIVDNMLTSDQLNVDFLSPTDIFSNTKTFPLVLDDIPSISPSQLTNLDHASRQFILNGKSGEVLCPPAYPWSFLDKITMNNVHPEFKDVHILELEPPQHGKTWDDPHHQQEFELVSSAFKFFLGVDRMRMFKLEKVVLLHNQKLESKFRETYHAMANGEQAPTSKKEDNVELKEKDWQQAIMAEVCSICLCALPDALKLSKFVKNVSGDERTNLVLCWHGGAAEPFKIAQENFRHDVSKIDSGYFGNGIYFTQFMSYGDKYSQYREAKYGMEKGMPFVLSWVVGIMLLFIFCVTAIIITHFI